MNDVPVLENTLSLMITKILSQPHELDPPIINPQTLPPQMLKICQFEPLSKLSEYLVNKQQPFLINKLTNQFQRFKKVQTDVNQFLRAIGYCFLENIIKYSQKSLITIFMETLNSESFNKFHSGQNQQLNFYFTNQYQQNNITLFRHYLATLIKNVFDRNSPTRDSFNQAVESSLSNLYNAIEYFDILMIQFMRYKIMKKQNYQILFDISQPIDSYLNSLSEELEIKIQIETIDNTISFPKNNSQEEYQQSMHFILIENYLFIAYPNIMQQKQQPNPMQEDEFSVIQPLPGQKVSPIISNESSFALQNESFQCQICQVELYHSKLIECGHKLCEKCVTELMAYQIMEPQKFNQKIQCPKCIEAFQNSDVFKFLPHITE